MLLFCSIATIRLIVALKCLPFGATLLCLSQNELLLNPEFIWSGLQEIMFASSLGQIMESKPVI